MGRFLLFFFLINIIVTAAALISCLSSEEEELRLMPRFLWVLLIILVSPIGAIVWFAAGKNWRWRGGGSPAGRPGPLGRAPDDDPDFLRRLDRERAELEAAQRQEADQELLRKWEDDLKRREEDLRKRDKPEE